MVKRRLLLISVFLATLAACVPHRMYRAVSVEEAPGFHLAFVEFDDQGEMWSPVQLSRALALIEDANRHERGALVLTFVHGWQHNASPEDRNVASFKEVLSQIVEIERELAPDAPRPVVGIYLGWRGKTSFVPLLKTLTFWGRANTTRRIAGTSATEVIYSTLTEAKSNPQTKTIVIGHSFGGQIVELALTQALVATLLASDHREIAFPADLVVLMNPAAKSLQAKQFVDMLERNRIKLYRTDAAGKTYPRPLVVSVTSVGDTATRLAFPAGLVLGSFTKKFRRYGQDYCSPLPRQKAFYIHTAGHNRSLHNLTVVSSPLPDEEQESSSRPLAQAMTNLRTEYDPISQQYSHSFDGSRRRFTIREKTRTINDTPYWIMSVPGSLIPDHSTIFGPDTARLLGAVFAITGAVEADAKTVMVREDGIRSLGLVALPTGEILFLDRSRRLYEIPPYSATPVFLGCLPDLAQPEDRIGSGAVGNSVIFVMNQPVGQGDSAEFRTAVLKVRPNEQGAEIEDVISLPGDQRFLAAAIAPDGQRVYLATGASGEIFSVDLAQGKKKGRMPALLARAGDETSITVLFHHPTDGHIYAADGESGALYRTDPRDSDPALHRVAESLGWPTQIVADPRSERLFVADKHELRVWEMDCSTTGCSEPRVFSHSESFVSPEHLAWATDGTLWVGDDEAQKIFAVSTEGDIVREISRVPRF
jgi:pimeloyl-ACP methyl ester carboxylesterase